MMKSTRRVRVRFGALVAALFVGLAALQGGASGQTTADVNLIGRLDRFPDDARAALGSTLVPTLQALKGSNALVKAFEKKLSGTLIPLIQRREVWQLWQTSTSADGTGVVVRDLETLEIKGSFKIPSPRIRRGAADGGNWMHDVDYAGNRIFFMREQDHSLVAVGLDPPHNIRTLGTNTFPARQGAAPVIPNGISWDPIGRRLWSTWGKSSTFADPFSLNYLVSLNPDPPAGPTGSEAVEGWRLLRGCRGALPSLTGASVWYSTTIVRRGANLYIPCHVDAGSGAIAVLEASDALDSTQTEHMIVGPTEVVSALADREGGRIHIITLQSEDWVYDIDLGAFVGVVALGGAGQGTFAVGIDEKIGRLLLYSRKFGLGYASTRQNPLPQARIYPDMAPLQAQETIVVDNPTNRIFLLDGFSFDKSLTYRILKIPTAPPPPPSVNPDQNTLDIDEQPGITEVDFTGSASAFGIRTLLGRGIVTLVPGIPTNSGSPTAAVYSLLNSKCGYTDRELVAAAIPQAKLNTGSSRADALGYFVDESTRQNMQVPSQCDLESATIPQFAGLFGTYPPLGAELERWLSREWKPSFSQCSGPSADPSTGSAGDPRLGSADVSCPGTGGGELKGNASGHLVGPILTGTGYSSVRVYKDPSRGIVSRAESAARGLEIGTSVTIEEIRSVAESWAKGRPGKARSTRTILISGFKSPVYSCQSCNIDEVITALNTVFVGKAFFRKGTEPDKILYDGTPRGAQSAVQKSDVQIASDRSLIGDGRSEVSALEMMTYNDTPAWGRARQLYQFAGVATAATYNISIASEGEFFEQPAEDFSEIEETGGQTFVASSVAPKKTCPTAVRALSDSARMLLRGVREAASVGTGWLLFVAPLILMGRRRLLTGLVAGGGTPSTARRPLRWGRRIIAVSILATTALGVFALAASAGTLAGVPGCSAVTTMLGSSKLLLRDVREALSVATAWLLFSTPLLIMGRRRLLTTISSQSA